MPFDNAPATSAPPRKPAQRVAAAQERQKAATSSRKKNERAKDASDFFDVLSAGATMFGMMTQEAEFVLQGAAISLHGEGTAQGLAEVAEQNAFVASLMDRLHVVNGVASIATAVLPLAIQVVLNHKQCELERKAIKAQKPVPKIEIPAPLMEQFGVLPPDMLLQRAQAANQRKVLAMQAAILREQQEAESEVAALQAQLAEQSMNGQPPDGAG